MSAPIVDIAIIGAQKAGTSSLARYLDQHPEVVSHPQQEFGYFVDDRLHGRGYDSEFQRCFPSEADAGVVLIKSVGVMFLPDAQRRLREHNPSVQLIVSLRSPIQRIRSAHSYMVAVGRERRRIGIAEALRLEPDRLAASFRDNHHLAYVSRSLYYEQLSALESTFSRSQIHVSLLDDLVANPDAELTRLQEAVGLTAQPIEVQERHNARHATVLPGLMRLARSAPVRTLTSRIPAQQRVNMFDSLRRAISYSKAAESAPLDLTADTAGRLLADLAQLEVYLERDLSVWRNEVEAERS